MQIYFRRIIHKTRCGIQVRFCWAVSDPLALEHVRRYGGWVDLSSIVRLQRRPRSDRQTSVEIACYISSIPADAAQLPEAIQECCSLGNICHRVMDVMINEDRARTRNDECAENLALLRFVVLNLLKSDRSSSSLRQ